MPRVGANEVCGAVSWLKGGLLSPVNEGGARFRQGMIPGLLGLAFLFLYVIDPGFDDPQTDLPVAILAFLALSAASILLVTPDWLHSSRSAASRHVAFYRSQLVQAHIQERCGVSAQDARQRWLGELRQWKDESHPNHSWFVALLLARYECRMVFYLQRLLLPLAALCFLALAVLAAMDWGSAGLSPFYSFDNTGLTAARMVFPLLLLGGYLYLRAGNVPDPDDPTGVWLRWREINDEIKAWWDERGGAAHVSG